MNKNFIASLMIATGFILMFAFVLPKYSELRGVKKSLDNRQVLLEDMKAAAKSVENLSSQYSKSSASVEKVVAALPSNRRYDVLLESLKTAASNSRLELTSMTVGITSPEKGNFVTMPVRAELSGTFTDLLLFIDTIEKSLRLIDIEKIDISEVGNKNTAGSTLGITLQAKAYSIK